jgi:hypothetical protein
VHPAVDFDSLLRCLVEVLDFDLASGGQGGVLLDDHFLGIIEILLATLGILGLYIQNETLRQIVVLFFIKTRILTSLTCFWLFLRKSASAILLIFFSCDFETSSYFYEE